MVEKIETIIGGQGQGNITPPRSGPATPGGGTSPNEPRSPAIGGIVVVNPIIANSEMPQSPNMENLYNLFLNYLLKPNEWVNSKIGSEGELGDLSRFYFRPDLIIAMVEQA